MEDQIFSDLVVKLFFLLKFALIRRTKYLQDTTHPHHTRTYYLSTRKRLTPTTKMLPNALPKRPQGFAASSCAKPLAPARHQRQGRSFVQAKVGSGPLLTFCISKYMKLMFDTLDCSLILLFIYHWPPLVWGSSSTTDHRCPSSKIHWRII